jgi:4-carboxymuconolactone decarboxylase
MNDHDRQSVMLSPLRDDEWPPIAAEVLKDDVGKLNVYRVMAHNPKLLVAWQNLRNHLILASALNMRQLELVTLRAGHRWNSSYEWAQHVNRGLHAGLTMDEIKSVRGTVAATSFDVLEQSLLTAVDQLIDDGKLSQDTLNILSSELGAEAVLDIMATVGMYSTLAFILKTFDVPLEPDFVLKAD